MWYFAYEPWVKDMQKNIIQAKYHNISAYCLRVLSMYWYKEGNTVGRTHKQNIIDKYVFLEAEKGRLEGWDYIGYRFPML